MSGGLWVIRLPLIRPLTLNARQHWAVKHREVAALRGATLLLARNERIPPHDLIDVQLVYFPKDRRRRDSDNLVATLKVACDALIDAGIVPDDDPAHMIKQMPHIALPDGVPRLILGISGITLADPNTPRRAPMRPAAARARRGKKVAPTCSH